MAVKLLDFNSAVFLADNDFLAGQHMALNQIVSAERPYRLPAR